MASEIDKGTKKQNSAHEKKRRGRGWLRRWGSGRLLAAGLALVAMGSTQHYNDELHSANESARIYAALAIVDHHTVALDPVFDHYFPGWRRRRRPPNMDVALKDERYLLDKAPGVSLLAVPVVACVRALGFNPRYSLLAWWLTLLLSALPSVLAMLWLWRWLARRAGPCPAVAVPAALLASPWLIYATMLFGHALAASLVAVGVCLALGSPWKSSAPGESGDGEVKKDTSQPISRMRLEGLLGGLCLGGGVVVEYPSILVVVAVLVALAASKHARRRLFWVVVGGLAPALVLCGWHWIAFGGPFTLPYSYKANPELAATHSQGLFGIGWPGAEALWGLLFSARRGLFYLAPWLLLGLAGLFRMATDHRLDRSWRIAPVLSVFLGFTLIAGFPDWHGGRAVGPRYLVFLVPVVAIGGVFLASAGWRARRRPDETESMRPVWVRPATAVALGLTFSSLLLSLVPAVGHAHVSESIANPIFEVVLPVLQSEGAGSAGWGGLLSPLGGLAIGVSAALAAFGVAVGDTVMRARRQGVQREPASTEGAQREPASTAEPSSRESLLARPAVLAAMGFAAALLHLSAASLPTTRGPKARRRVLAERKLAYEVEGHRAAARRLGRVLARQRRK